MVIMADPKSPAYGQMIGQSHLHNPSTNTGLINSFNSPSFIINLITSQYF